MLRIGEGYDIHRLEPGRRLVLAGVVIESPVGCAGHSDGDAAAHALCDALLGALGAGDIGEYFPPGDPRWRDADSMVLLAEVCRKVARAGARLSNVDVTIVIERPRIAPYRQRMRERLAEVLGCPAEAVSVKAKTAEGLGPIGRGEAVEARAVALVEVS
ncbi:MAG: 2-C-methyl-D-erythritol 2,4-cyclodiphosphate synthase [Deltaproteobacteria bacterium]|nr:MAG: 2-C-methyl-D-erythritol 2,4-cyclodiphosphate synthase [Deltaproteobacteria bacterium]